MLVYTKGLQGLCKNHFTYQHLEDRGLQVFLYHYCQLYTQYSNPMTTRQRICLYQCHSRITQIARIESEMPTLDFKCFSLNVVYMSQYKALQNSLLWLSKISKIQHISVEIQHIISKSGRRKIQKSFALKQSTPHLEYSSIPTIQGRC